MTDARLSVWCGGGLGRDSDAVLCGGRGGRAGRPIGRSDRAGPPLPLAGQDPAQGRTRSARRARTHAALPGRSDPPRTDQRQAGRQAAAAAAGRGAHVCVALLSVGLMAVWGGFRCRACPCGCRTSATRPPAAMEAPRGACPGSARLLLMGGATGRTRTRTRRHCPPQSPRTSSSSKQTHREGTSWAGWQGAKGQQEEGATVACAA